MYLLSTKLEDLSNTVFKFYQSMLFPVHNWIVCTVLPGMYTIFAVVFAYNTGTLKLNKCFCFWNPFNILNGINGTSTNYNIPLETRVESMKVLFLI